MNRNLLRAALAAAALAVSAPAAAQAAPIPPTTADYRTTVESAYGYELGVSPFYSYVYVTVRATKREAGQLAWNPIAGSGVSVRLLAKLTTGATNTGGTCSGTTNADGRVTCAIDRTDIWMVETSPYFDHYEVVATAGRASGTAIVENRCRC